MRGTSKVLHHSSVLHKKSTNGPKIKKSFILLGDLLLKYVTNANTAEGLIIMMFSSSMVLLKLAMMAIAAK